MRQQSLCLDQIWDDGSSEKAAAVRSFCSFLSRNGLSLTKSKAVAHAVTFARRAQIGNCARSGPQIG